LKISKLLLFAAPFLLSISVSHAAVILTEGFNDITTLAGAGWVQTNNSTAGGTTAWFQGTTGVFAAQSGAADSYIAANFLNAGFGGDISNWLILPNMTLANGDTLTFWTRTETDAVPGDNLQVRLSSNGGSTNVGATTSSVGDFGTVLTTVGGAGGYPESWTQFVATVSGLAGPTSVRLAFRYVVSDTSNNGDYIGIDSVSVNQAVPEPGTLLMLGAGMALLAVKRVRSARA